MSAVLSITESQVFTVLGNFIQSLVTAPLIQGLGNRVSTPNQPFIAMTPGAQERLSTNVDTYAANAGTPTGETMIMQSMRLMVQIDCYGPLSSDWATIICTAFWDTFACQYFETSGIDMDALYTTDPREMPLVDGEAQYEKRMMFEVAMQVNPILSLPIQSAIPPYGPVDVVNVDVDFLF